MLIATNRGDRWIFVYGFAKNHRTNIGKYDAEVLKKLSTHLLSMTAQTMKKATEAGELIEVDCHAQDEFPDSGSGA